MPKHLPYCLIIIFCFAFTVIWTQTVVEPLELTIEDGLFQGYISALHQDKEGFLWIGTKNGLNWYDGSKFILFEDDNEPSPLSKKWIKDILEIGDLLLITSNSSNLYIIHKPTKKSYTFSLSEYSNNSLSNHPSRMWRDKEGHLWFNISPSNQVLRLSLPMDFETLFPSNQDLLQKIQVSKIEDEGYFWLTDVEENKLDL